MRRIDAFTRRSVLISPGRRGIGGQKPGGLPEPSGRCPFCPGHEADSEQTIMQWPERGTWSARVVSNKFPAVSPLTSRPIASADDVGAYGKHEVVIESRDHDADLADYDVHHMRGVLAIWRTRVRALESEPMTAATALYRNRGRRAGSSQPHPHTQLVATAWIPAEVSRRWQVARDHLMERGESVYTTELERELRSPRVLRVDRTMVSFCPYAPTRAYEMRIAPRDTRGGFSTATDDELQVLAAHLVEATGRLRRHTTIRDYNVVLRQPPARETGPAAGWHLEILPRTGGDAGFELAAGEMIVVVSPEDAAAQLTGSRSI